MKDRILTALGLIVVFVPIYFYAPDWVFILLSSLLGFGMLSESYRMTYNNGAGYIGAGMLGLVRFVGISLLLIFVLGFLSIAVFAIYANLFTVYIKPGEFSGLHFWVAQPVIAPPFILFVTITLRILWMNGYLSRFVSASKLYKFQVFDIGFFILLLQVCYIGDKVFLFRILSIVVGIDSIGYFTGKYFGKRHIVPTISPNKTLEGYMGGLAWTMIGGSIIMIPIELSILALTLLLGMVYILAITGDLLVSYQKRLLDVKDSGTLLPGHGGLLDRFDSWMFVTAFVFYYLVMTA